MAPVAKQMGGASGMGAARLWRGSGWASRLSSATHSRPMCLLPLQTLDRAAARAVEARRRSELGGGRPGHVAWRWGGPVERGMGCVELTPGEGGAALDSMLTMVEGGMGGIPHSRLAALRRGLPGTAGQLPDIMRGPNRAYKAAAGLVVLAAAQILDSTVSVFPGGSGHRSVSVGLGSGWERGSRAEGRAGGRQTAAQGHLLHPILV